MASHLRRQIREGVATAITGLATTGSRVFQSRVYPLADADLPALCVYCEQESSEVSTIHPHRTLDRKVEVIVEGVAKTYTDLDDTLDQIAKEVEIALANPVSALSGKATEVTLRASEMGFAGSAEKPVGRIRMTYEVEYFAAENAPDVAL